ncbi:hypothetical protein Y032_0268g768, partial [Ancylostoma ceylanicum]
DTLAMDCVFLREKLPELCNAYDLVQVRVELRITILKEISRGLPPETVGDDCGKESGEAKAYEQEQDGSDWRERVRNTDEPLFIYNFFVSPSDSSIDITRRIIKYYCAPHKRPIFVSHSDKDYHLPLAQIQRAAEVMKESPLFEVIPRCVFDELEARDEDEGSSSTDNQPKATKGDNHAHAPLPERTAKEEADLHLSSSNVLEGESAPTGSTRDYVSYVAKTGKSPIPWNDIRPAFLKFLQKQIRQRVRQYVIDSENSSSGNEDSVFSTCELVYDKLKKFHEFPPTFHRICEILTNPPRCYARLPTFIYAMNELVDVAVNASQQKPKEMMKSEEFFTGDSKFASSQASEPKHGSDPDYDCKNNTHVGGRKKRQTDKRKRKNPRRDGSSPESIPEHLNRKKSRLGKKAMSDLSNYNAICEFVDLSSFVFVVFFTVVVVVSILFSIYFRYLTSKVASSASCTMEFVRQFGNKVLLWNTGSVPILLCAISTKFSISALEPIAMSDMILDENWMEALCLENEVDESTEVETAANARRPRRNPAQDEVAGGDGEKGEAGHRGNALCEVHELQYRYECRVSSRISGRTVTKVARYYCSPDGEPRIVWEIVDDGKRTIPARAKVEEAASKKKSTAHHHRKAANPDERAPKPNNAATEDLPGERQEPERNPSDVPVEGSGSTDSIVDYLLHVAETGSSTMRWHEARPAVIKYLKSEIRERVRQYLMNKERSNRKAEDAEVLRICQNVCNKLKKFRDFPSSFRVFCRVLMDPLNRHVKLLTFVQALKTLANVDETASIWIEDFTSEDEEKEDANHEDTDAASVESQLANEEVNDPRREVDSGSVADYESENATPGRKKRRTRKQKRSQNHRVDDSSTDCDSENRQKSKAGKEVMSDMSNLR